jgi:hypothetical protein
MNAVLSYPDRYNFDIPAYKPYAQRCLPSLRISVDCYRIPARSVDVFLSDVYLHALAKNVAQEHLASEWIWRYCDIEMTTRKRFYRLALIVCAPYGHLTRRLHYLYRDSVIERAGSGFWLAHMPNRDSVASDSLLLLIQSLTE